LWHAGGVFLHDLTLSHEKGLFGFEIGHLSSIYEQWVKFMAILSVGQVPIMIDMIVTLRKVESFNK
jgi:hypothetical protein